MNFITDGVSKPHTIFVHEKNCLFHFGFGEETKKFGSRYFTVLYPSQKTLKNHELYSRMNVFRDLVLTKDRTCPQDGFLEPLFAR